jgi:hypothetical protein
MDLGVCFSYVCDWKNTGFSLFANLLWCYYCFNSHLIIPHFLMAIALYVWSCGGTWFFWVV